ncbi:kinase-like protein [Pseudovirgaria hyperparasitica]|uniref:Kinase-like protein n=1 Tax=Pseudovirgaria hyperparasitica TaxID=470096 RepID=A0A6A6WJ95_9PEZI|nr:kinase-like protein [Pseudovirgaria hyperparasitica]KAF2762285.1 kinase-like protein [Pseudovirgaria hyperparasitica]
MAASSLALNVLFCHNICIKSGELRSNTEANTQRFIAKHTSIPVPAVHHAFAHGGKTYILMERIHGDTLGSKWTSLSEASRSAILLQLKCMLEELRGLVPPSEGIANVDGGPLHDCRLPFKPSWGPFDTVSDFHLTLRNDVTSAALDHEACSLDPVCIADVKRIIAFHDSVVHRPVFTHGDLNPRNILVRDGKIVAIIDWETAAWMPYYWEYTTIRQDVMRNTWWHREVHKFLQPYESEYAMDSLRRQYFGEL